MWEYCQKSIKIQSSGIYYSHRLLCSAKAQGNFKYKRGRFSFRCSRKFNIKKLPSNTIKKEEYCFAKRAYKKYKNFLSGFSLGDRTRSFFKIQDGCNYFCSFCTIPLARGKSRSSNIENTIIKAKEIGRSEVKEVVLTGVNIGDFGHRTNENFYQLIKQLDKLNTISRYRISSIEPDLLKDEIINFVNSSKKFTPHFHIPLQSGSDKLLRK